MTNTPAPSPTPSPTATHTPAPTPTPVQSIFGPQDGSLTGDDGLASVRSGVDIADFVAEATLVGDLPTIWISMRAGAELGKYQAVILNPISGSPSSWLHRQKQDGADSEDVRTGLLSNLRTGADARNHIRVAAYGDAGLLFINGAFVSELDFSAVFDSGEINLAASGEWNAATFAFSPVSVGFENFTITSIDADAFEAMKPAGLPTPAPMPTATPTAPRISTASFGPVDGSLTDDDGTAIFRSGVNLADFVAEVTFVGDLPYIWMPMRVDSELENFHVVSLDETSGSWFAWRHSLKRDGADPALVQSGISNMRTGANARNHVRVAAYGEVGLLFINGAFVAELDFGGVTSAGNVDLAAFGERDDAASEYEPVSVGFVNFTVAPLDADAFEAMRPAGPVLTAFGPVDGSLTDDDGTAVFLSGVNLADFVVEVTFVGDMHNVWILMRLDDENENYHVVSLRETSGSSSIWRHSLERNDVHSAFLQSGVLANVRTGANARNHVRVIAYDEVGLLFVNGAFVAELDFGGVTSAGNVELAAFGERDDATSTWSPVSLRYENFTVRPLEFAYGPRSGSMEHEDGEFLSGVDSGISMSDGVIEATFSNPYSTREGSWSVAILFRYSGFGDHAVAISSKSAWHHSFRTRDTNYSPQYLESRYSQHISASAGGSNRVRVVAIGEDGWLFINGAFIARLDLSGGSNFGEVTIVGSYFEGDLIPGRFTRFSDFAIHAATR